MQPNRTMLAGLVFVCCLVVGAPCLAQDEHAKTQIIYAGKLMGYFRSPSHQNGDATRGCSASGDSAAAVKFEALRASSPRAILVGAGDNFAPQLEARTFNPAPPRDTSGVPSDEYAPGNKELYYWYETKDALGPRWVFYREAEKLPDLNAQLALGRATIPTDNVGCFLAATRFAAIVPGKHDFYFGAERVRALARFMASLTSKDLPNAQLPPDFRPPQMLAANLVIKTSRTEAPSPITSKPKSKWEGSSVKLGDGKSVYPWFSSTVNVKIPSSDLKEIKDKLEAWFKENKNPTLDVVEGFLAGQLGSSSPEAHEDWDKLHTVVKDLLKIKVCPANEFNEVGAKCEQGWEVEPKTVSGNGDGITYPFSIPPDPKKPWSKDLKVPIFEPGRNYGLCQITPSSAREGIETKCQTFSVYRPFLSFPRVASATGTNYTDPDPFVVVPDPANPKREVAIFGIVDPSITQQVGLLNYSWLNEDPQLKSVVSAEDPAEALKEQVDYFESWYQATHNNRPFDGLRILLAQMSPQRAKVLAARQNKFQLVVTEANEEQGTSEVALSTEWNEETRASSFIAVPAPYYRSGLKEFEGNVHFGMVEAEKVNDTDKWKLQSRGAQALAVTGKFMDPDTVTDIFRPFLRQCVDTKLLDTNKYTLKADEIRKLATLCAMRQRLGADVALIQKRDRFDRVSADATDSQQIIDHLIWKGDLLTLMYVPGSALKKALDTSKKYDDEDSDSLSLSDERGRGLEFLGIKKNDKNEYLINEVPLDDKKIYAVATTDYIGAGDTGYPDLAAAALDPKTRTGQFPERLELISALVCRKVDPNAKCTSQMFRNDYLDQIVASAPASQRKPGFLGKVANLFPFTGPEKTPWKENIGDALDQRVQQRTIWMLSLKNFGFSFNGLNNNDTDISIDNKYGGNSTSGVNAHENHTITVGLDLRAVRSTHSHDWFAGMGIDYKTNSTDTSSLAPHVTQSTNRLTTDWGFLWNLSGGRSAVRWGPVFTLRAETQLAPPFTRFDLSSSNPATGLTDQLEIPRGRSVMVMPRFGLRHQNRTNMFEAGFEKGKEFNVLMGYEFVTNGVSVICTPQANRSIDKCIKDGIKEKKITKDSQVFSAHEDRPRMGFYWKWNASIPLHEKVKIELNDEGDWYFADPRMDLLTDTRFRDIFKSSLKFTVFPNFTIGPSLNLLLYRNQKGQDDKFQPIGGDFLSQKTFGFEASYSFDWFNRREAGAQIKHKP